MSVRDCSNRGAEAAGIKTERKRRQRHNTCGAIYYRATTCPVSNQEETCDIENASFIAKPGLEGNRTRSFDARGQPVPESLPGSERNGVLQETEPEALHISPINEVVDGLSQHLKGG